jgi:hypothetical protein
MQVMEGNCEGLTGGWAFSISLPDLILGFWRNWSARYFFLRKWLVGFGLYGIWVKVGA